MNPNRGVRDLGTLVTNLTTEKIGLEGIRKTLTDIILIPIRGSLGGLTPNRVKEKYFVDDPNAILNKEKSQKSAEIWLLFTGITSTYLAYKGLSFSSSNTIAEMVVRKASLSFLFYASFGVVDNIFRFTGHYNRKQRPGTITNELIYGLFIERLLGEEKLFSFLNSAKEFYYLKLPKYTHSFCI